MARSSSAARSSTSRSSRTSSSSPRSKCAPRPAGERRRLTSMPGTPKRLRLRGRAHAPARGSRASGRARDLGVRPTRGRAHVRGDGRRPARFLVLHAPGSGFGDYIRGTCAAFDQLPAPDAVTGRPRARRRPPHGRSRGREDHRPAGATRHRARRRRRAHDLRVRTTARASAERSGTSIASTRTRSSSSRASSRSTCATARTPLPAGTLVVFPPTSSTASTTTARTLVRCFNFHMPSFGFADYMRGKNPDFDQFDPPEDGGATRAIVAVRLAGRLPHDLGGARRRGDGAAPAPRVEDVRDAVPQARERQGRRGHWKDGGLTVKLTDVRSARLRSRPAPSRSTPAWVAS